MKRLAVSGAMALVTAGLAWFVPAEPAGASAVCSGTTTVVCSFSNVGTDTFTVPLGVTQVTVDALGAQGGPAQDGTLGGNGGEATATISVAPGETLQVNVGGQPPSAHPDFAGFNGGGAGGTASGGVSHSNGGGGGGASDVRQGGTDLGHRVVVAGGGGGGGNGCANPGGAGGGTNGGDASNLFCNVGGTGASQTGPGRADPRSNGSDGTAGAGGSGGSVIDDSGIPCVDGGGGGGGGLFGGGGGGEAECDSGGGGGGSGFTPSGTGMANGVRGGNGKVTITYTVACTRTVSSPTTGFTASGTTCVSNTTVNGSITVPAGASLVMTGSTVNGSVVANGAAGISICGSRITSSLTVQNSTGRVLVGDGGDESPPCAGNSLGGSVLLSGNTANTELGSTHVSGSVTVQHNTGTARSTETSLEIEANTIGSSLVCSGNSPTPVNDGLPNHVTGARTGQCSGL